MVEVKIETYYYKTPAMRDVRSTVTILLNKFKNNLHAYTSGFLKPGSFKYFKMSSVVIQTSYFQLISLLYYCTLLKILLW